MIEDSLKSIDLDRYLSILSSLARDASAIRLVDAGGQLLAEFGNCTAPRNSSEADRAKNQHTYEVRLRDRTVATLQIEFPPDIPSNCAAGPDVHALVDCLATELRLNLELDDMASELAGRYEELNLIYSSSDAQNEQDDESAALQRLIENCVEFLDTDMVVLFYGKHEIYQTDEKSGGPEQSLDLISCLKEHLVPLIERNGETLIINHNQDPAGGDVCPGLNHKILACPVTNTLGVVAAVLVSLKRQGSSDFFNSDRNLLEAMARRVAKIDQTNYDSLTGLMRRQRFESSLDRVLKAAYERQEQHAVLQMDLEQLQVINELYGREAGDALIRHVAETIRSLLRHDDLVAYFGRGKYGVLIRHAGEEEGLRTAEQIRGSLTGQKFSWNGKPVQVSLSAGVAVMDRNSRMASAVLEAAETAASTARQKGGGRTRLFRSNDDEFRSRKEEIHYVNRIQEALRGNLFQLYCQPIKSCAGGGPDVHCEILVRLISEEGRLLSPGVFLSAAERYYLMPLIDRWVIDTTFRTVAETGLAHRFDSALIAVNLSGQSLAEGGLAEYIDQRLQIHRLSPRSFCFEITETTALGSLYAAREVVAGLRERGFRFSLDDFGTGLSSFSYLKEFPVDYLKIDGSFVRGILVDQVSLAMVESINQIGHIMKLKTIAEFVENSQLATCLESIGVDYLQGYGVSEPLPFDDYIRSLMSRAFADIA